jgi:AcrR family transcriptional regulator
MDSKEEQSMEQAILEAAEKLFLEKGFASTSTTQIAREVGCNQALVHYYYRTKENLFNTIFENKFKLSDNPGAARFAHECQHLLVIHTRTPEAFTAFVVPVLDEFIEQIDALTNATNVVQVTEIDANKIAGIIPRLKREDRKKAFEVTEQRSAEFINLVNDPTSSFSELNEAVASQIVTALSLIQLALTDAQLVAVDRSSLEPVVGATVSTEAKDMIDPLAETPAETPAPSYISEFPFVINQIKVLKAGSKEYNAKIKFFSAYINLLNGHEVQDIYRDASKIVFNGDLETTVLVNKLLNIA